MTRSLLIDRELGSDHQKSHFPLVNRAFFENEKERFEIDVFGILSLARLPIAPPWLADSEAFTNVDRHLFDCAKAML